MITLRLKNGETIRFGNGEATRILHVRNPDAFTGWPEGAD